MRDVGAGGSRALALTAALLQQRDRLGPLESYRRELVRLRGSGLCRSGSVSFYCGAGTIVDWRRRVYSTFCRALFAVTVLIRSASCAWMC